MAGHWVNRRPGYRCRRGRTSAHPADADSRHLVSWPQIRVVEEIAAAGDSELAESADAGQLSAHLRTWDMLVVCGSDTVTLEDPVRDDAERESPVEWLGGRAVGEMLGDGQLILPLPTCRLERRTIPANECRGRA